MRSLRGFSSTSPTFLHFAGGGFTLDLFPNQAKAYVFLEFVSLPPLQPSPTGERAILRQILLTAAALHMDSYETVAIFAANAFPPPVGEG